MTATRERAAKRRPRLMTTGIYVRIEHSGMLIVSTSAAYTQLQTNRVYLCVYGH